MILVERASSDTGKVTQIKTGYATGKKDREEGNDYLSEETLSAAERVLGVYENKSISAHQKLSRRSRELDESRTAINTLETFVRDAVSVLQRKVKRENLPPQVFSLYGLPLDGKTPHPGSPAEWITIAGEIVEGDDKAHEQGFGRIACPSALEVLNKKEIAGKEHDDVSSADRNYDKVQEELAEIRNEAAVVIEDILAELRFNLRKMDDASKRRIMRTYGVQFRTIGGDSSSEETPDN